MNPALEYIDRSPEPYRFILLQLQLIVENTIPDIQLKFKWGMPFYYLDNNSMFCFLNYRKTFVDLGLMHGNRLSNVHHVLIAGENRKMLRSLRYTTIDDINETIVKETLLELFNLREEMMNNVK